jgi:hypothetical protein
MTALTLLQRQEFPLRPGELGEALTRVVLGIHLNGLKLDEAIRTFKKRYIECVLADCGGNKCAAARAMGVHRNTLSRDIAELRIDARRFNLPGTRRRQRKQIYASKERAVILGGDLSGRPALAPVRTAHGPREVNAPEADEHSASAVFTNSVRKGGRGESPELSQGGAAHLAQDRKPPCVESFAAFQFEYPDLTCGGLKA